MTDLAAPLTVSVAMSTHNGMPYVVEQLRSILHQSRPVNQLVVSDDASSDDTVRQVREIIARRRAEGQDTPALSVLENAPALGIVRNFEQAIRGCTGDLVALCDQDDLWTPNRIERMASEFETRPELTLLHTDARLVDNKGAPMGLTLFEALEVTGRELREVREGRAFDALLRRNIVTGATVMFRRELAEKAEPFTPLWIHDEWLAIHASALGRMDYLPDALVDYRQHGMNQIGARKATLRDKIRMLREPRAERNEHLFARARVLTERFERFELSLTGYATVDAVRAKFEFEKARQALPASRWRRPIPVLRNAMSGGYSRFARGLNDVARDLVQPAQSKRMPVSDPR